MWRKAKTTDEIIQFNIKSIKRECNSPFLAIDLTEQCLTSDVKQFQDEIIKINEIGFMTLDSQISASFKIEYEEMTEDNCGYSVKKEIKTDAPDMCYQRAYCNGFLKKNLLFSLAKIASLGYEILHYDYLEPKKSDHVNLTYYDYSDWTHYSTNLRGIDAFAEIDLQFLHRAIHYKTLQIFVEDMCYVVVYDNDYNTGKNIYLDLLSHLI